MTYINRARTLISLMLLTAAFLLSGCNAAQNNVANKADPSPPLNQEETQTGTKQVPVKEKNKDYTLPKELPTPIIQTRSGNSIPAVQGSYCWGNRCVDYAGDLELLEGKTPVPVLVGENVSIDMDIDIPPDEFILVEYVDGEASPISYTDGSFQLSQEPGTHYYGAFVRWSSRQDPQVSLGDTSFAFVVRVVEKK